MSLKTKMVLFFGLTVMLTVVCLSAYMYMATSDVIGQSEQNLVRVLTGSIEKEIQDVLDFTEVSVKSVVENARVQELFAKGDRDALFQYLSPTYESMKTNFPQAHFHTPESVSFLRLQNPKKHGDDLSGFRHTVNEANRSKQTVRGIEEGVSGFGFRVVMPVMYRGDHVGSFEYGKEIESGFLKTLQSSYGGDFILYRLTDEGKAEYLSSTMSTETAFEHEDHVVDIQNGASFHLVAKDGKFNHYIIPLRAYNGETVGFMVFRSDRSEVLALRGAVVRNTLIAAALIFALVLLLSFLYLSAAFKPLHRLVKEAEGIAEGDFTKEFDTRRKDEIGMMNRSLAHISSSLREMFAGIAEMSSEVADNSEGLSASGQQMTASNEEVGRNVAGVSELASDQLASIDDAKDNVNFVAEKVSALSESVKRINHSVESVIRSSSEGSAASVMIEEKMKNLKQTAEKTTESIDKLNRSSKEIENIITTIQGIANETNMLSLNASIEAARAGEAGRGFAIVAGEVGKLAEQSKESTNSIDALIKEIQGNMAQVVDSMVENNEKLEEGIAVVNDSKATFKAIEHEVGTVVEHIEEITGVVEDIYSKIDHLLRSFDVIVDKSAMTANNIDAVKMISAEQTQAMSEITHAAIALAELASDLQNAVSRFRY